MEPRLPSCWLGAVLPSVTCAPIGPLRQASIIAAIGSGARQSPAPRRWRPIGFVPRRAAPGSPRCASSKAGNRHLAPGRDPEPENPSYGGTEGSNPPPSSGESDANLTRNREKGCDVSVIEKQRRSSAHGPSGATTVSLKSPMVRARALNTSTGSAGVVRFHRYGRSRRQHRRYAAGSPALPFPIGVLGLGACSCRAFAPFRATHQWPWSPV